MMLGVSDLLEQAAGRVAERLVSGAPAHGPSAAAVGIGDAHHDLVTVARGHRRALDDTGQPLVDPSPLPDEPVFDVGSVTKVVVTTALCLSLVEAGRLRLDAPVSHWFPEFAAEPRTGVTVRDLLEHRAGLWEWWPTYCAGAGTAEQALRVVRALPLRYPPGSGRHYSDLGFMLLGEIISLEYDAALADVARDVLFSPLGMDSSGYREPVAAPVERVVATSLGDGHERRMIDSGSPYPVSADVGDFDGWRTRPLVGEVNDGNCWHAFGGVAGHAGLFTTVPDLLRFGRALLASLAGEGPWSGDVVRQFFSPGRDPGQALGFRVAAGPAGPVVQHPGFPGCHLGVLPDRARVVVLLTNRLHTRDEPPATVADAWSELVETVEVG